MEDGNKKFGRFILNEQGEPVPEPDLHRWSAWFETANRQVAKTYFGDIEISTVFLGVGKHNMLFETMVFADGPLLQRLSSHSDCNNRSIFAMVSSALGHETYDIQKRYATRAEALEGHKNMCRFVESCLKKIHN